MKKKYICPTTKLLKMDVGYGIMAGSGGRDTNNNGRKVPLIQKLCLLQEDLQPKAIMPGKHGMSFKPFTLLFNRLHLYL